MHVRRHVLVNVLKCGLRLAVGHHESESRFKLKARSARVFVFTRIHRLKIYWFKHLDLVATLICLRPWAFEFNDLVLFNVYCFIIAKALLLKLTSST